MSNAPVSESQDDQGAEVQMMEMTKNPAPPGDQYVDRALTHAQALAAVFPVHNTMHP